ncbi:MAG TPA: NADH-quinone oxidoreductase subunit NuoE [Candidatus Hydrogenedentes bacterium]|nr:MAG: NADP-reducing hydrogenase subunit HndA [Candidatus Hydrogenedentes bacterium ADurb.Bin179]HOH28823.1 NADH-quinone oxidoreductase subunit NuoE [Candidatus Hydrogenedentota bacterium]
MSAVETEVLDIKEIVAKYPATKGGIIAVLQEIQERDGYLSPEALDETARLTGISVNEIYGVATFYSFYKFNPPGRHVIQVCLGTACHVRGGAKILSELERLLKIKVGEVTPDGKFELNRIACLGCCALEPVVAIDGKFYPRVTARKLPAILAEYQD